MKGKDTEYPYRQKGVRKAPDRREVRVFVQAAVHEGGSRTARASAVLCSSLLGGSDALPGAPGPSKLGPGND